MNGILKKVKEIIDRNLELYLPHVTMSQLENNGAIYYMNGRDGTEFDWYVNDKCPPFMVFYNDKDNLGAVKLLLYKNGDIVLYIYDEKGKKMIKEVHTNLAVNETELFELAVILRNVADDNKIWDGDIERLKTDTVVNSEKIMEFKQNKNNYDIIRNRKILLNLKAYVSKRITNEGWKVGYMERSEPFHGGYSGWSFFAGNEDDTYTSDPNNIVLIDVGIVCQQFDADIFKYIDMPIGTRLIRISLDTFEIDKNDKEIYMVKR